MDEKDLNLSKQFSEEGGISEGEPVSLKYLQEVMSRADLKVGSYQKDIGTFQNLYNFIRRFMERNGYDAQTVLFTAVSTAGGEISDERLGKALNKLEEAVFTTLRRVDVSAKYSNRQLVAILMGTDRENGRMVALKILKCFDELNEDKGVSFKFDIAEIEINKKVKLSEPGKETDLILIIDDDSSNLMLGQKILGAVGYKVACAKSGELAFKYLKKSIPSLILLDVNMPEMDGFMVMNELKKDIRYRTIPVIFLTANADQKTELKCFESGAIDFVSKPFAADILRMRVSKTLELEHYRKDLEHLVKMQTKELEEKAAHISRIQESVIIGMANLIESRDGSTGKHVKNTQTYVRLIVEQLIAQGLFADELDDETAANIIKAAPLHDVGKVRIPDSILLKPGKLTDEEYETMKLHTLYGYESVVSIIGDVEEVDYIKTAEDIAYCHHERWDGKGYPRGLKGEEIPLGARIMAVADVFDALYEERCYKKPIRPVDNVIKILMENSGTQFDPVIVDVFAKLTPVLKEYLSEEAD